MNYTALGCWYGNILHSDPWLQGPLAPYLVKRRILKRPVQNKRTFASRFFELFALPASLRLNTQRRSAPSMRALRRRNGERPYFCEKNSRVQNNCVNYWLHVVYVSEGSNNVTATWKKDFFPWLFVCLFILLLFFCHPHFSFFSSHFFCYPHFSIRIFASACATRRYPVRVWQTPPANVS